VKTGESGTHRIYGMGTFEYLAANPDQSVIFNEAMAENTRRRLQALVSAYDFAQFDKIIDIGGGNGALMTAIVATNPKFAAWCSICLWGAQKRVRSLPTQRSRTLRGRCRRLFSFVPGERPYILKSSFTMG